MLARHTDAYVGGLTAYRQGDPRAWFDFFAEAVAGSARIADDLVAAVRGLQRRWTEQAGTPRAGPAAAAIIAGLPEAPVIDLATARTLSGASAKSTLAAIDRLAGAGVLHERTGRRRGRVWECVGLFALLDAADDGPASAYERSR